MSKKSYLRNCYTAVALELSKRYNLVRDLAVVTVLVWTASFAFGEPKWLKDCHVDSTLGPKLTSGQQVELFIYYLFF